MSLAEKWNARDRIALEGEEWFGFGPAELQILPIFEDKNMELRKNSEQKLVMYE